MKQIAQVTFLVRDYDEAIAFFCEALEFELLQDRVLSPTKRWVVVRPRGDVGTGLLLAKATTPEQERAVGQQSGGRVGFFLHTDDFVRDHSRMKARGVRFTEDPRNEDYGVVAVFLDLYGNRWDLIEPREIKHE